MKAKINLLCSIFWIFVGGWVIGLSFPLWIILINMVASLLNLIVFLGSNQDANCVEEEQ